MSEERQAPSPSGPRPWHLLWALPVSLVLASVVTVVAAFGACGVSGCSGGGFGPAGNGLLTIILCALAGAILATPLIVVGWTDRRVLRVGLAGAVAVGWTAWTWLTVTGGI